MLDESRITARTTKLGQLMVGDVILARFKKGKTGKALTIARVHSCDPLKDFRDAEFIKFHGWEIMLNEFDRRDGTSAMIGVTAADFEDRTESIQLLRRGVKEEEWRSMMDVFRTLLPLLDFESEYQKSRKNRWG